MSEIRECLEELVNIVQGHLDHGDTLDSFTLQPAQSALGEISSSYCPKCGSCGHIGCCGLRCFYLPEHVKEIKWYDDEIERLTRENERLKTTRFDSGPLQDGELSIVDQMFGPPKTKEKNDNPR